MTISERIRQVRGKLSQAAFAEELGIHKNSVGSYEHGKTKPDIEFLCALCTKFHVDPGWLILGEGDMRPGEGEAAGPEPVLVPVCPPASRQTPKTIPVTGLASCGLNDWYNPSPLALRVAAPAQYEAKGELIAVVAIGASMRPDGIRHGYLVYCDAGIEVTPEDPVFIEKDDSSASLKRYLGKDDEWLYVQGWLEPNDQGLQKPYSEKLALSSVKRVVSVVAILCKA